jgi:hypothetical protein
MDMQPPPPPDRDPNSTLVPPLAGTNVFPDQAKPSSNAYPAPAGPSYKGLAITSWILLGGIAFLSVIPVLGFATWVIAVPVFIVTLILAILILTRRGILQGVLILLATFIFVPIFIAIAPIITTAILGSAANSGSTTSTAPQETARNEAPVQVDVVTLASAYKNNPIRADAAYRNKTVVVKGIVTDINRNITGNPFVTLSALLGMPEDITVNCYFAKENESQVTGLSKGDTVTIKGVCTGLQLNVNVEITECELQR